MSFQPFNLKTLKLSTMNLKNKQLSQSSPLGERKGGSFKNYLESQGKSKSTVEHYYNYLIDFLTFLDTDNTEPENATTKEVMSFLNILQKRGQSNKTRAIRLTVISHFFEYQIENNHRSDNPTKLVKNHAHRTWH